ncbi:MAG: hypothetical protein ABIH50_00380 [bacterium]
MINGFKLIKAFLLYMLFSAFFKVLIVTITGSYLIGSLFIEASILLIYFVFITYLMKEGYHKIRLDWVKIYLLVLFIGSVVQSIYFISSFPGSGIDLYVRAFAPFRKYFFPLFLFSVFTYVLSNDLRKNNIKIFDQLIKFFNLILFIAIFYQFAEAILRLSPTFNAFYVNSFIAPAMNADIETSTQLKSFATNVKAFFPFGIRVGVLRIFGIGLDYFVSGSIIFLCYMYNALFREDFKLFSLFNFIVFIAILLTGTLQFILPFFIFNFVLLFIKVKSNIIFRGMLIVLLLLIIASFSGRVFDAASGYGPSIMNILPEYIPNINLVIIGAGPLRTNLDIEGVLTNELDPRQILFLESVGDVGYFRMTTEIGLILCALFIIFYSSVIMSPGAINRLSDKAQIIIKKLKFLNLFTLLVFISHYLIYFSRTTMAFCLLLLSLLYSYSTYVKGDQIEKNSN